MGCSDDMERSPWIRHICDYPSAETESQACDLCYRVTCSLHLRPASVYNQKNAFMKLPRSALPVRLTMRAKGSDPFLWTAIRAAFDC